jgi:hypothetical protein
MAEKEHGTKSSENGLSKQELPELNSPSSAESFHHTLQKVKLNPRTLKPNDVLQLQRRIGNRAVQALLTRSSPPAQAATGISIRQSSPTNMLHLTRWEWNDDEDEWVDIERKNDKKPNINDGEKGQIYDDVRNLYFVYAENDGNGAYYCAQTQQWCNKEGYYFSQQQKKWLGYDPVHDRYYDHPFSAWYLYKTGVYVKEEVPPTERQKQLLNVLQQLKAYTSLRDQLASINVGLHVSPITGFNKEGNTAILLEHTSGQMKEASVFPNYWMTIKPDGNIIIRIRVSAELEEGEFLETVAHEIDLHGEKFFEFLAKYRKNLNLGADEYAKLSGTVLNQDTHHAELVEGKNDRMQQTYDELQGKDPQLALSFLKHWHFDRLKHAVMLVYKIQQQKVDSGTQYIISNKKGEVVDKYFVPDTAMAAK